MTSDQKSTEHRACILVVDDERDNREILDIILTWEGYSILTAASGEEALAILALRLPDLILLDIMMPGMNGYEVAVKVKGDVKTKAVRIVMFSALASSEARTLGMSAGAEAFLTKPLDRVELVSQVKTLLAS